MEEGSDLAGGPNDVSVPVHLSNETIALAAPLSSSTPLIFDAEQLVNLPGLTGRRVAVAVGTLAS